MVCVVCVDVEEDANRIRTNELFMDWALLPNYRAKLGARAGLALLFENIYSQKK
jgi:hypothetical protein